MMSAPYFEDESSAEAPRRVRKKVPPRYVTRLNPGPGLDIDHAPFSKTHVESLAAARADALRDAERRCLDDEVAGETHMATALKNTVHDLLRLYSELFGRKATISKEGITSRPIGPTLRFVQGALQVMGVETSDENILRIYRQKQETVKTNEIPAGRSSSINFLDLPRFVRLPQRVCSIHGHERPSTTPCDILV